MIGADQGRGDGLWRRHVRVRRDEGVAMSGEERVVHIFGSRLGAGRGLEAEVVLAEGLAVLLEFVVEWFLMAG